MATKLPEHFRPLPNSDQVECTRCHEIIGYDQLERGHQHSCGFRELAYCCSLGMLSIVPVGSQRIARDCILARGEDESLDMVTHAPNTALGDVVGLAQRYLAKHARLPRQIQVRHSDFDRLCADASAMESFAPKKPWDLNATTDAELIDELIRRNTPVFAAVLSDEKLRAECNRRWGEDDCPMAKTLRHERDRARDETERVAERAAIASAAVVERDMRHFFAERGPSAAEAAAPRKPAPKTETVDLATLADLVAADA